MTSEQVSGPAKLTVTSLLWALAAVGVWAGYMIPKSLQFFRKKSLDPTYDARPSMSRVSTGGATTGRTSTAQASSRSLSPVMVSDQGSLEEQVMQLARRTQLETRRGILVLVLSIVADIPAE